MKTRTLDAIERELLADPEVRAEFDALDSEFSIARALIAARARAGLSQGEVAERMGTTQSVVARLESGRNAPNLRTIRRYAEAVGARLTIRLDARPS
jgi:ribosome-binding protein aMBF1 (putative translation factor)